VLKPTFTVSVAVLVKILGMLSYSPLLPASSVIFRVLSVQTRQGLPLCAEEGSWKSIFLKIRILRKGF